MTSILRKLANNLLNRIASILNAIGITPNLVTILGILGHVFCAIMIANGNFKIGAGLLLLFGLFDAMDGSLARFQQKESEFGAFLDSVSDRISEIFIFLGILFYFISHESFSGSFLVLVSAFSSFLVSYIRARAEAVGVDVRIGLLTRVERYLVLIISLAIDRIEIGLLVISILSMITICQRIWYVYRHLAVK